MQNSRQHLSIIHYDVIMSKAEKDKIGTGTKKKLIGFIMLFSGKELRRLDS